jgi:antirestriction protein
MQVSVALRLSTVILTVTACDKFERMFQLCRSCDGSAFEVFIAAERIGYQVLFQNGENIKNG